MKKAFFVLVVFFVILCLSSCERSIYEMEREAKREAIFNEGFEAGYEEGRKEGFGDAQFWLEEDLFDISTDIEEEHGISPDEAILILENYANGEPIIEEELTKAIWVIRQYYYDSQNAINDIENSYGR